MQPLTYVLKTLEKQALNGPPLVTLQCVPALDVKMLLRRVPRPPTLTYVLLTYVLAMPEICDCDFLRDFWGFGSVNAEITSDCNCAIVVR